MTYEYGPLSCSIEEALTTIQKWLTYERRVRTLPAYRRSSRKTRNLRRIRRWSQEIDCLISEIDRVKREVLPIIEQDVGYTFPDQDRFIRILMDVSTRRLFLGILTEFPEDALPIPARDFAILGRYSEDAQALALIGGVTLRLKVLPDLCVEDVSGLVDLSDRWKLHESLIGLEHRHRPAGESLDHKKETLAWAVLGLLYVEGGVDALQAAVPLIEC